jgi:hypothetical protein
LPAKVGRVLHPVEQLRAFELVEAFDLQRARLEGAHAGGDEDGLGQEAGAPGGLHVEAAVVLLLHHVTVWPRWKVAPKGSICLSSASVSSLPVHTGMAGMS